MALRPQKDWYSIDEVAERFGVCALTIRRKINEKLIPATMFGNKLLISKEWIELSEKTGISCSIGDKRHHEKESGTGGLVEPVIKESGRITFKEISPSEAQAREAKRSKALERRDFL